MEIGTHIKEHRAELGLSQDDLAERIYVSRQTISNWETGRTYPDVQSLLLLSGVFGVTVDSLIKGDVEAMEKNINAAARELKRLNNIFAALFFLYFALLIWGTFQYLWGWGDKMAPTVVFVVALFVAMTVVIVRIKRIRKSNDLITMEEVLAFERGEFVDRENGAGSRIRAMNPRLRVLRKIGIVLVCGCAGGAVGYLIGYLVELLT